MSYQNEKIKMFSIWNFISFYDKSKIMKIKKKIENKFQSLFFILNENGMNERYTDRLQRLVKSRIHKPGQEANKGRHCNYPTCFVLRILFPFAIPSVVHGLWKNLPAFDLFLVTKYIEVRVQGFQTPRNR